WVIESCARATEQDPRSGAAVGPGLHRRPGRHAYEDAPGGVPGRGHLRSSPARGECARSARADRRRPTQRALSRPGDRRRGDGMTALAFELPSALEAREPPEERGLHRDEVRLLVASRSDRNTAHRIFNELPEILAAGDLLVVNVSATLPAA